MGRSILAIILTIALIGLFAQLAYDLPVGNTVVPISGQTFALLLAAWFLRPTEIIIAVILYLLLGGAGLPIFADGASGWKHLVGFTAGYLWTFIPAAALVSYYRFKYNPQSFPKILVAQIAGTMLVLFAGAFFLSWKAKEPSYFAGGSIPYLPGGVIKSLIGTVIIYGVNRFLKRQSTT